MNISGPNSFMFIFVAPVTFAFKKSASWYAIQTQKLSCLKIWTTEFIWGAQLRWWWEQERRMRGQWDSGLQEVHFRCWVWQGQQPLPIPWLGWRPALIWGSCVTVGQAGVKKSCVKASWGLSPFRSPVSHWTCSACSEAVGLCCWFGRSLPALLCPGPLPCLPGQRSCCSHICMEDFFAPILSGKNCCPVGLSVCENECVCLGGWTCGNRCVKLFWCGIDLVIKEINCTDLCSQMLLFVRRVSSACFGDVKK